MEVTHWSSSAWQRTRAKLVEVFSADLRSLATLRIVLALLVLVDLARRATDLVAHYSDEGVLPRSNLDPNPYSFSLNTLSGTPEFQALLFALAALGALSMLVGYRTRLATFTVWLLVLSIQVRNPLVLTGGDTLLHLLLFWSIFLPLGAVWSIDRVRASDASSGRHTNAPQLCMRFFSVGTVALFLQIALMYWVTAINKYGEEWRWDGTALYYALSYDRGATELGSYLLNFPVLLTVLTFATLALEALGPFLLFSPLLNGPSRTTAVAAFMGFHFGILATLSVGLFSLVAALCMVCFLPGWFWEKLLPKLRAGLAGGVAAGGNLIHRRGRRWSPSPTDGSRRGLLSPGGYARDSSEANRYSDESTAASPEQGDSAPSREGARGHDETAKSRPVVLRSALLTNLLALGFLLNVLGWNLASVSPLGVPTPAYQISVLSGLSQGWFMFAPSPPKHDGWWIVPGELENGKRVDVLPVIHNDYGLHEVSYQKPKDIGSTVKNWQKYMNYMTTTEYTDTPKKRADQRQKRESFSGYLCQEWNERHAGKESLESLSIVYVREYTPPPGQNPEIEQEVLHEHSCD